MSCCWENYSETLVEGSQEWIEFHYKQWETDNIHLGNATCLLPEGHEGPHVWTPDSEIEICFAGTDGVVVDSEWEVRQ